MHCTHEHMLHEKKKKKKAKAETKKQENHMTCVEENMHAKKS